MREVVLRATMFNEQEVRTGRREIKDACALVVQVIQNEASEAGVPLQ